MSGGKQIEIVWSTEDIDSLIEDCGYSFSPELTEEEKYEVLKVAKEKHDANNGITWGVLELILVDLYDSRITR